MQSTPSNWPDVPWDQQCDSTTSCPDKYAATYFTQKRLAAIKTEVWSGSGTSYRDVEQWVLTHTFTAPGDGRAKLLWLSSIEHSGLAGDTQLDEPSVTFTPVSMSNRVDTSPTKNPIQRLRVSAIDTEYGGQITVTYSAPDCVLGSRMPASADTNTLRCFPVWWTPYGTTTPTFDWFDKYVVTAVAVTDKTGSPAQRLGMVTTYQYLGNPAWHSDDNEIVPAAHRSWGQWRGYGRVRTLTGAPDTAQLQVDTVYFQGMNGDKTATGSRTAQLGADPDFGGTAINDENWRNGQVRETIQYNGVGDSAPVVAKTLFTPWESGPTAQRSRNGLTEQAYLTGVRSQTAKTKLDGGRGWRTTTVTNTFDTEAGLADPYGRIVAIDDTGDTAVAGDEQCTRSTYATDPAGLIRTAVAEVRVVAAPCATASPDLATTLVSDVRTRFDGATGFDKVVTKGDVTSTEQQDSVTGGVVGFATTGSATFDAYGRVLTAQDPLGRVTTTQYTPASGAQATTVTVTNAKLWTSSRTIDPAYGNVTSITDQNGLRSEATYDALGRLTATWLPGRDRATQSPNTKYGYLLGGSTAITSASVSTLNTDGTGYITSYTLYDGLMRPRQTQAPAVGGGVVLTDTIYDSRGLAVQASDPYFQSGVAWGSLFTPSGAVPGRTVTTYDNAGRVTAAAFQVDGVERWRSTMAYGGDRTDTAVPAGGTATSVSSDAVGRTTQLLSYHGSAVSGSFDTTTYGYDIAGDLTKITDPGGSQWKFTFDLRHRRIKTEEPDRGTTQYTYDNADHRLTMTDARSQLTTTVFDELGRETDVYQGTAATGTLLVHNGYDGILKGQQSTATRYTGGQPYTTKVLEYQPGTYRPTKSSVVIPASEGAPLAGEYVTSSTYNANGSLATTTLPAVGGGGAGSQAQETLTHGYNELGLATTLSGTSTYVTATAYDPFGRISTTLYNDGGAKNLAQLWSYEPGTARLVENGVYDNDSGDVYQDTYYTYDNSGNTTSIKDLTAQYGAGPDDNQCFRYDYLQRLTNAWTPSNGNCGADPAGVAAAALGGPAPYWQSWTYDAAGNRKTETNRTSAGDAVATSTYPLATAAQPHAVTKVAVAGPGGASATSTYGYDPAGDTTGRAVSGKPAQTLTWDPQGRLSSVTDSVGTAAYVYAPDGGRLIARDSSGTTLYLGPQEVHVSKTGQVSTTRFYDGSAVRTSGGGLFWTTSDPHGTSELMFKAADLSRTQRRLTPFGAIRGSAVTWPTSHGFVGGLDDPTGLTQIGARAYDKALGRFASVDPMFDASDPRTFTAYGYASNDPVSASDRTGLSTDDRYYGPCGKGGELCPAQPSQTRRDDGGGGPGNSRNADDRSGSGDATYVNISPHVKIRYDDPARARLEADWTKYQKENPGAHEWNVWYFICTGDQRVCAGDMMTMFVPGFGPDGQAQFENGTHLGDDEASVVIGAEGEAAPGADPATAPKVVRTFSRPESMVGATEDDLKAMLPQGTVDANGNVRGAWKIEPLSKGKLDGWRAFNPDKPGNGQIRFLRGGAPGVKIPGTDDLDPLHNGGDYGDFRVGGLQYKFAMSGNPAMASAETSIIYESTGSMGSMAELFPEEAAEGMGGGGE